MISHFLLLRGRLRRIKYFFLVAKLKETGEYDNTIIIFTSDNGPTGEGRAWPLRGAKGAPTEGGTRVPTFIRGPGIQTGSLDR